MIVPADEAVFWLDVAQLVWLLMRSSLLGNHLGLLLLWRSLERIVGWIVRHHCKSKFDKQKMHKNIKKDE